MKFKEDIAYETAMLRLDLKGDQTSLILLRVLQRHHRATEMKVWEACRQCGDDWPCEDVTDICTSMGLEVK